nr:ankyrin repeat domain-containing protein [Posidoniimonas polymericola]
MNGKDSDGDTLLTQAIRAQLWGVAHALLDAGANPAPKGIAGSSPMHAASEQEGPVAEKLFLRLLEMGVKPDAPAILANAIDKHSPTVVKRLCDSGAKLQSKTSYGDPLLHAFQRGDLDSLRLLLRCGAKVVERKSDWGVLGYGAMSSADPTVIFECAEVLLAEGANPNHSDGRGFTPLHASVRAANPGFAAWLISKGAKPSPLFDGNQTPLDLVEEELRWAKRAGAEAKLQELREILEAAGGRKGRQRVERPDDNPVLDLPPSERRGICEIGFSKAYQIMVKGEIDAFTSMLQKDKKIDSVERDAYSRMGTLQRPIGDLLSIVKLKGQPWLYVSGCRPHHDSPMQAWSKKARLPVLLVREESVSGTLSYALYDRGECQEAFESDGQWFRGGVEIDPDVHDDSERMQGTDFRSQLRDPEEMDWSLYESEWEFVEQFLRSQDAYLTFVQATLPSDETQPAIVCGYHPDEVTAEQIERVDFAYYKPDEYQQRAAKAPKTDNLYEAIRGADVEQTRAALAAGAELNQLPPRHKHAYLTLALGGALHLHDHSIVDLLLSAGADPNFGGHEPPLVYLTDRGGRLDDQVTLTSKLVAAGADINKAVPKTPGDEFVPYAHTALHVAARAGDPIVVKLLLRSGADPSLRDSYDQTALQLARSRLKHVRKDLLRQEPSFTTAADEIRARETVDLLAAVERGDLDPASLPTDDELIASGQLHPPKD